MSWAELPYGHYVLMTAAWLSLIVYIMIASVIFINRLFLGLFKNAFFTLVIAEVCGSHIDRAVPEIAMILLIELRFRPMRFGLFVDDSDEPQSDTKVYVWLLTALQNQIVLAYIPFALNRFTAFYRPVMHKHIWTTQMSLILVFLTWIPPMALAFINSYADIGETSFYSTGIVVKFYAIQAQAITTFTFIVCLPLYILAFIYARKRVVKTKNRIKRQDMMQLACAGITFTTIIFDFARNMLDIIGDVTGDKSLTLLASDLWFYSAEVMCVVQPWAVLMTNVLLRKHIRFLCRRRKLVFPSSSTGDLLQSSSHGTTRASSVCPQIDDDPSAVHDDLDGGRRRDSAESSRADSQELSLDQPLPR